MIENMIRDALTWFTAHRLPDIGTGSARFSPDRTSHSRKEFRICPC